MIHRRTFVDDRYGVGEALDEHAFGVPLVVRGKHLLYYGSQANGEDPVEIDCEPNFWCHSRTVPTSAVATR